MSTPKGFVVVGETDWLSTSLRSPDISLDSRLRSIRRPSGSGYVSCLSAGARRPSGTPIYAEAVSVGGGTSPVLGISTDAQASTAVSSYIGELSGGVGVSSGFIFTNATNVQTGLASASAAGTVFGVSIYVDAGQPKVQFWVDGVEYGDPEDIGDDDYHVGGSLTSTFGVNGAEWNFRFDAEDMRFLPPGHQPWGAAARVADAGGYSSAATEWTAAGGTITLDAYRRAASDTGTGNGIAIADDAPDLSRRSGMFWLEFAFDADAGTNGLMGLVPRGKSVSTAYVGLASDAFGYFTEDGSTYSGAINAYGSALTQGQRLCALWEPSSGKLYFAINDVFQNSGDPLAGTGAAFTTATADLVPAITPYQGRWRLCTHAREQLYRPSYAEAWDGSDLLPEQHFVDRLAAVPSVRREVSYYPWANQRQRGAAIGALELINADGMFDALSDYDLRDQTVIAYRTRADGSTVREFTALVDGVTQPAANRCRIALADMTAKLDVRVDSPVFALGSPYLIPSQSRIGSTISSDVAQSTNAGFKVYDQALEVTSWTRDDDGNVCGFTRTANPAGLQSVREFVLVTDQQPFTINNSGFANWTAGVPDDWDVQAIDSGGTVTQSGNTAILTPATDGSVGLVQTLTNQALDGNFYQITLVVTAASGTPYVGVTFSQFPSLGGSGAYAEIVAPGTYTFIVEALQDSDYFTIGVAFNGSSVTIDSVTVQEATNTTGVQTAIGYLIETEAGLPATAWEYSSPLSPYLSRLIGYWSKDRPTIRRVFDDVCESSLLDYFTNADGVIQLAWLLPPEEVDGADTQWIGEIVEEDLIGDLTVADDYAPRLSTVAEYQRNYAQHNDGDIAGAVTNAVRTYFTSEGRRNQLDTSGSLGSTDAGPLHPFYSFANNGAVWPRLLVNEFSDSKTPAPADDRDNGLILLHRCYATRRRFYSLRIRRQQSDALALRPGGVVELTHARYGLSSGKNLMVVTVEASLTSPSVALLLWG